MKQDAGGDRLASMRVRPTEYPHIFWNEDKNLPCVAGTRLRVQDVLAQHKAGHSIDEITGNFPPHTRAEICSAPAYYYDHQSEIDQALAEDQRHIYSLITEVEARQGPSPVRRKQRAAEYRP